VALDAGDFLDELDRASPEFGRLVSEHLIEQEGELLLHLLVADIRRVAEGAYERRDRQTIRQCLDVMELGLRDGDYPVQNAVAVSFVEDIIFGLPRRALRAWPPTLQAEAKRTLAWRPGEP